MQNLLRKIGLSEKMSRNFWGIMIIAFAGAIIYGLPYFRYDYYDAYLQVYNLTDAQMGVFGSILGVFGMISYLFGGMYVTDSQQELFLLYHLSVQVLADLFICYL